MADTLLEDHPTAPLLPNPATRRRRSGRVASRLVIVAGALVVVAGAGLGIARLTGSEQPNQGGYAPEVVLAGVERGAPVGPSTAGSDLPATLAPDPRRAAEVFLDAEIAGNARASFAVLDPESQEQVAGLSAWEDAARQRPDYLAYRIVGQDAGTVTIQVEMSPRVSEISGVVPGRATIRLATSRQGAGYQVSLGDTYVQADYPSGTAAAEAARAWAGAANSCLPTGDPAYGEFDGTVIGTAGAAQTFCPATALATLSSVAATPEVASPGVAGMVVAGTVGRLDALDDPSAVLSHFGADATEWARVVRVTADETAADVVLAPLGDRWVVVGVFAVGVSAT